MRRPRDPRQSRLLTLSSLRWVVSHRAWTPYHLVRYWRYWRLRVRHPDVVTEGFVFLGRGVELQVRPGYGRLILGRWVHLGDGVKLRAHEGTLRLGDKVVFGANNVVNCYLDIEIGAATLVADWVYITDFDHATDDLDRPIKDQGIVKSPVRIGPDCWLGTKVSVLRGAMVGRGCVLAAHTVVRGTIPDYAVVAGVPGRVVRARQSGADPGTVAGWSGIPRHRQEGVRP
ncbi:MAG: acyltransferase [Nocardioidaceae bacterium]|nr:acyltransferase [Nocardioidaceae bacterium]MDQ3166801.1 acyltransferase [Actinomycetota bacterium]